MQQAAESRWVCQEGLFWVQMVAIQSRGMERSEEAALKQDQGMPSLCLTKSPVFPEPPL
jgi:hypothetical protein